MDEGAEFGSMRCLQNKKACGSVGKQYTLAGGHGVNHEDTSIISNFGSIDKGVRIWQG